MDSIDKEKSITVTVGKSFSMYGVNDIRAFDEGYVSLDTRSGKISVEGRELKIESLSKDDGYIVVKGDVSGVYCDTEKEKSVSLIKRMFGK